MLNYTGLTADDANPSTQVTFGAKEEQMKTFWLCWIEQTKGGWHHQHATIEEALKEAERLARLPSNRGHKVYVLGTTGYCEVPEAPIEWHHPVL